MNISMIPNNDVKTIHASQGDTQRVWNFVPYGENGVINTSQDEYASFDSIKGNTLVWNQILQNGNFASTSGWASNISANTISASSNELTITINSLNGNVGIYGTRLYDRIANHKYLFKVDIYTPHATTMKFANDSDIVQKNISAGWNTVSNIFQSSITSKVVVCYVNATSTTGFSTGETIKIRNYQCFDLTQMGLDVTAQEFVSYFPLSYYPYDSGSLLSFNGSGIKTVGFNQWDEETELGTFNTTTGANASSTTQIRSKDFIDVLPSTSYFVKANPRIWCLFFDGNKQAINSNAPSSYNKSGNSVQLGSDMPPLTTPSNARYMRFYCQASYGTTYRNDICINISSSRNGEYEPYEESITNLPTLTYFPSGMKSAGSVYDELTPSKAVTRVGTITATTANRLDGQNKLALVFEGIPNCLASEANEVYNATSIYPTYSLNECRTVDYGIAIYSGSLWVRNKDCSTVADYQTWLASNPLTVYYELATPTEADVDLDLTYPIEVGGTEEILPSSLMNGSVDLGSLAWTMVSSGLFQALVNDLNTPTNNLLCKYATENYSTTSANMPDNSIKSYGNSGAKYIYIKDSTYSSADAFMSAMSGVYLWYEKTDSEPTTTPIKADIRYPDGVQSVEFTYKQTEFESMAITGSMVCKGLEIEGETDENGITIQSTSELTSEPGFFDCKLKLTQGDGVCYSSKFQLHVERRP